MTTILGIDPGSQTTGYGIIKLDGNHAEHITHGHIRAGGRSQAEALHIIYSSLHKVITEHGPDEAAIERVFMHKNADSALKLGQARGAAIVACAEQGIALHEYTANQVKLATVGRGHAAKQQVQHMVKVLLCLPELPQADAADALAVALCHGHTRDTLAKVPGVSGVRRGRLR